MPEFFKRAGPFSLTELARRIGGELPAKRDQLINNIRPLAEAGPGDLTFFDNPAYMEMFKATKASACLLTEQSLAQCPADVLTVVIAEPAVAYAELLGLFYPDAKRPGTVTNDGISPQAFIHESVRIGADAAIDPGVVVGEGAVIGNGVKIAANAVIGPHVHMGENCSIGAGCVVQHAVLGNRVILHPGVKIGQDGFGYKFTKGGHKKIPQVGRVVVHDDVEIGANTTVDRGTLRDTVIGEGTKIDNLVQIAHNCEIGRRCIIAGHVGLSGSVKLGDGVMLAGQVGIADHLTIGNGARIGAKSGLMHDVPAGEEWLGTPAVPLKQYFRQMAVLRRNARGRTKGEGSND